MIADLRHSAPVHTCGWGPSVDRQEQPIPTHHAAGRSRKGSASDPDPHAAASTWASVVRAVTPGWVAASAVAGVWDPDLLVVGTHARGWSARLMLGSVAEAALRDAPCNVLAVPPVPTAAVVGAERPAAWGESPELQRWLDAAP